jgi:hypothetical protein
MNAGRRKALMRELAQIVLATAAGLAWMAARVHAGDPAPSSGSIYDGQWSCEFRAVTNPGGTLIQTGGYDMIRNHLFTVIKSSFQVDKNGSFSRRRQLSYIYRERRPQDRQRNGNMEFLRGKWTDSKSVGL